MGNKFEATVRRAAMGMALIKGTGFLTASIKSCYMCCNPRRLKLFSGVRLLTMQERKASEMDIGG